MSVLEATENGKQFCIMLVNMVQGKWCHYSYLIEESMWTL
jgi:hypothetical protein